MMRRWMWELMCATLLAILCASASAAQQLRGVVRDSASRAPVPGAVVTVVAPDGSAGNRAITDAAGQFAVVVTNGARLRLVRIGFRPRDVAIPDPATAPLEVLMTHLPPMLDLMRVTARERCPDGRARTAAFEIWEQVRAGLLATIVTRELNPAIATTMTYQNSLGVGDERVYAQRMETKHGRTTRPFIASAQPSFFAKQGYLMEDGSDRIYSAPDADVLIDESFATTHCFRLRGGDRDHRGQVAVEFSPAPGRDTIVDVEGVIWIDEATPRLRSLDFRYTSLEPAARRANAGGHIEFQSMANGASFISWWNLRLATVAISLNRPLTEVNGSFNRVPRSKQLAAVVTGLDDSGGEVFDAVWPDGTRWQSAPATLAGVVKGRRGGEPVANALVRLRGSSDTVRTDSTGAFHITTAPGRYTVEATDTTFASFVAPRTERASVELRRGATASVRLELQSLDDALADICHGQRLAERSVLLAGAIATRRGEGLQDARVNASWNVLNPAASAGNGILQYRVESTLDDDGRFVICGAPRDARVQLTFSAKDRAPIDTAFVVRTPQRSQKVLWVVP